jgi:hypothetical protein
MLVVSVLVPLVAQLEHNAFLLAVPLRHLLPLLPQVAIVTH